MSVQTNLSVTIQTADQISGNSPAQKIVSGLSYAGSYGEFVNTKTIGCAAPTGLNAVGSTTGGSLAANTYYYKVVALDGTGNTTGSNEVSVTTTGSTSSVALTWTPTPGATGYRVYRGTSAGSEDHYQTSTTNSFTDTGATGTSGTVPGSNTTATSWTPTLAQTPEQFVYVRNLAASGSGATITVTWTPTGGSSAAVLTLGPQDFISFLHNAALSGTGITALSFAVSAPGTTIEGQWTA